MPLDEPATACTAGASVTTSSSSPSPNLRLTPREGTIAAGVAIGRRRERSSSTAIPRVETGLANSASSRRLRNGHLPAMGRQHAKNKLGNVSGPGVWVTFQRGKERETAAEVAALLLDVRPSVFGSSQTEPQADI